MVQEINNKEDLPRSRGGPAYLPWEQMAAKNNTSDKTI